jgi:hypothetical protein
MADEDTEDVLVVYGPIYTRRLLLSLAEKSGFAPAFSIEQWNALFKSLSELGVHLCRVEDDELLEKCEKHWAQHGSENASDGFPLKKKKAPETP